MGRLMYPETGYNFYQCSSGVTFVVEGSFGVYPATYLPSNDDSFQLPKTTISSYRKETLNVFELVPETSDFKISRVDGCDRSAFL